MLGYSEACERNKDPILNILKDAFILCSSVLEIGSGTGQHAIHFGMYLPHLQWQPTDLIENLSGISERLEIEGTDNVKDPLELDISLLPWKLGSFDGVFTANTLHIMPIENTRSLFRGLDEVLMPGGILCIYGPFRYNGEYTSRSNESFDRMLRDRDPQSGIRDFEYVNGLAREHGLSLLADHNMPANNQCIVWRKEDC